MINKKEMETEKETELTEEMKKRIVPFGLGVGEKDCPDCLSYDGCEKHYIKDGDRHDRIKEKLSDDVTCIGPKLARDATLRDYFAGMALQGYVSNPNWSGNPLIAAIDAYDIADAMIEARKK